MKTMFSILGGFITAILVITVALCISVNSLIEQYGNNYIVSAKNAPRVDAVIIPGAKVNTDGTPSNSLKNRLDQGLELYEKGCAQKILLSGFCSVANGQKQFSSAGKTPSLTSRAYEARASVMTFPASA